MARNFCEMPCSENGGCSHEKHMRFLTTLMRRKPENMRQKNPRLRLQAGNMDFRNSFERHGITLKANPCDCNHSMALGKAYMILSSLLSES